LIEDEERLDIVHNVLQRVHPSDEVSFEEEVEDEDCNFWAEVATRIQKIELCAKLIAGLSHEVSLLRQQLSSAPSKTTQGSSSSSIPPRIRSRSPPSAKSPQKTPPPNSPYLTPPPNSPKSPQKSPPPNNPKSPQKSPLPNSPNSP